MTGTLQSFYEVVNCIKNDTQGRTYEDAKWSEISKSFGLVPCKLHILKQSPKCRACTKIQDEIDSMIKRNAQAVQQTVLVPIAEVYRPIPVSGINSLLLENVHSSDYYKTNLAKINKPRKVIREIKDHFDTYAPWTSIKKGLPSKFWACVVRFTELKPNPQKVEKYLSKAEKSQVIVFLSYFIRFAYQPMAAFEALIKLFSSGKTVELEGKKHSITEFIRHVLSAYKIQGLIAPEIGLSEARRINWKMNELFNPDANPI